MRSKFAILASASALGLWACAQADILPDMAAAPGFQAGQVCGIEVEETRDGLLLTGWAVPHETSGSWRMVVHQRTGGGGFDIVQEGEIPRSGEPAVAVSDMLIDTGADFNARLTTWDASGETTCRYGGRV